MILYADELNLLGRAGADLHLILREVDGFDAASGMRSNTVPGKTEILLTGFLPADRDVLKAEHSTIGGEVIQFVPGYKYLGIWHSADL